MGTLLGAFPMRAQSQLGSDKIPSLLFLLLDVSLCERYAGVLIDSARAKLAQLFVVGSRNGYAVAPSAVSNQHMGKGFFEVNEREESIEKRIHPPNQTESGQKAKERIGK